MNKSDLKVKYFVVDQRKESEKIYNCSSNGLPFMQRKKKHNTTEFQHIFNRIDQVTSNQVPNQSIMPIERLDFLDFLDFSPNGLFAETNEENNVN
ncbi:hypothetical protein TVAG_166660 [Trichomonas vaginalis G3]|uniref:Uncharacterized protein n=1 Tax=Trichomonas vaginalis (strain ATCC PRA-98 / G3) TaxID=412133 RepID=A2DE73_TRIV3|nr:hypothetical protein TVAGG3_0174790 [Trichomonas vaginalis G3]EAY21291.1 hypothetical protein TVAG_166660 [Trichomonas vaginalis G3]KAI5548865.1 hypothetical protein TVAGG3_0174790 [Trichomonas vaginalis G3]|eukprot:XP_001582277.1 hypothetical protein [Trichomonas vaginalis G3]